MSYSTFAYISLQLCFAELQKVYLLGLKTICWGCWVFVDLCTQPFSYLQSWGHLEQHRGREAYSLLLFLETPCGNNESESVIVCAFAGVLVFFSVTGDVSKMLPDKPRVVTKRTGFWEGK